MWIQAETANSNVVVAAATATAVAGAVNRDRRWRSIFQNSGGLAPGIEAKVASSKLITLAGMLVNDISEGGAGENDDSEWVVDD